MIARAEAVRLAKRVIDFDQDLAENTKTTTTLLRQTPARVLLDKPGIGPVTAAVAMVAWSHDGRLHSEAAFTPLAGVSPNPASPGNTVRHRLDRHRARQDQGRWTTRPLSVLGGVALWGWDRFRPPGPRS